MLNAIRTKPDRYSFRTLVSHPVSALAAFGGLATIGVLWAPLWAVCLPLGAICGFSLSGST
jgi:fatty acid desaturase